MLTYEKFKERALSDPEVRAEYDALKPEFALFEELLRARKRAGLTQAEVAERMDTKPPAVARLESGGGSARHSPSVATLRGGGRLSS